MFVPTKTSAEWVSMWENNPSNVTLRTTKEEFKDQTVTPNVYRYLVDNEGHCDNG